MNFNNNGNGNNRSNDPIMEFGRAIRSDKMYVASENPEVREKTAARLLGNKHLVPTIYPIGSDGKIAFKEGMSAHISPKKAPGFIGVAKKIVSGELRPESPIMMPTGNGGNGKGTTMVGINRYGVVDPSVSDDVKDNFVLTIQTVDDGGSITKAANYVFNDESVRMITNFVPGQSYDTLGAADLGLSGIEVKGFLDDCESWNKEIGGTRLGAEVYLNRGIEQQFATALGVDLSARRSGNSGGSGFFSGNKPAASNNGGSNYSNPYSSSNNDEFSEDDLM